MNEGITAEFVGGPRDGETTALERLEPRWLLPIRPGVEMYTLDTEPNADTVRVVIAVYDLAIDPSMKRPSINDVGHYRYEFRGYQ